MSNILFNILKGVQFDKPQLKPKAKAKAKPKAKAWAEVFYIITKCARARARAHASARPHARAGDSLISQLLLNRIKPNFQDNLGPIQGPSWWQKILPPPLSQNPIFWQKRGVKPPKISQKLNQLGFGSNFQGKLKPINDQNW